jgi:tetratricopeptide (TPR) repeat protein
MIITSLLCAALAQTPQQATKNPVPPPRPPAAVAAPGAVSALDKGLALYKRQQFQAARQAFQQAVDAEPENAAAHFYLGYTLYKIAEPTKRLTPEKQEALQQFSRCFELDPNFVPKLK